MAPHCSIRSARSSKGTCRPPLTPWLRNFEPKGCKGSAQGSPSLARACCHCCLNDGFDAILNNIPKAASSASAILERLLRLTYLLSTPMAPECATCTFCCKEPWRIIWQIIQQASSCKQC